MQINVSIQLSEGDTITQTPDEIAAVVLEAIGDSATGYCAVGIMQPVEAGSAGTPPIPPPPEE